MYGCVIAIVVVLIILIVLYAIYYSLYSNKNYVYYDGTYYTNDRDSFKRGRKLPFTGNPNSNSIISTTSDIPIEYSIPNTLERNLLNNNIGAAQGKAIAELYRWQNGASGSYLPNNGGQDSCTGLSCIGKGSTAQCSGYGEDITCPQNNSNGNKNHFQNGEKNLKQIQDTLKHETMFGKHYKKHMTDSTTPDHFQANLPRKLDAYNRSGPKVTPEDISQAEQEQWLVSHMSGNNDPQNDTLFGNSLPSSTHIPGGDYSSYITNLVADPRVMENQKKWSDEMFPWSGTAFSPDDGDEMAANSLSFTGLRRPQAVAQSSAAMFITEIDAPSIINNPKFNFNG